MSDYDDDDIEKKDSEPAVALVFILIVAAALGLIVGITSGVNNFIKQYKHDSFGITRW